MALLRLFLNHSHTINVKPSSATALKPLLALLHTHGSTSPQGLSPSLPWLVNPPELGSQPSIFLDLAKKSKTYGHLNPTVNISSHQYAEEMFLKVLEQCDTQIKLLGSQRKILEGSESKVLEKPEQETEIWADSVKKKRRKKMNKHKYKKLRKRLRRKTKK